MLPVYFGNNCQFCGLDSLHIGLVQSLCEFCEQKYRVICVRCTMLGDLESETTDHSDQAQSTGTGPVTHLLNVNSPRMRIVSYQRWMSTSRKDTRSITSVSNLFYFTNLFLLMWCPCSANGFISTRCRQMICYFFRFTAAQHDTLLLFMPFLTEGIGYVNVNSELYNVNSETTSVRWRLCSHKSRQNIR